MRSNGKVRTVVVQSPPFEAKVTTKARDGRDEPWARARAESILLEKLDEEFGIRTSLRYLSAKGVYTVEHLVEQGQFVHHVYAPDGVDFTSVEEIPNWWEAVDSLPMEKVPNGYGLIMSLTATVSLDAWRKSSWPDRPHP